MEPKSRFDHELDVWEPTEGTSRFERLDRGLGVATRMIRDGASFRATSKDGSILVQMGAYQGSFPSFEIGFTTIGEAIDSDTWVIESVPGACSGGTPIDRFLLEGGAAAIENLGGYLHIVLVRSLGERTFTDKGVTHRVYRKGVRKARGEDLFVTLETALAASEEVLEGSLMPTP
jgi:hypothetical protein